MDQGLHPVQRFAQRSFQRKREMRGLQPLTAAKEQFIPQRTAQSPEGGGNGRLRKAQMLPRADGGMMLQQGIQHPQQVQIEVGYIGHSY